MGRSLPVRRQAARGWAVGMAGRAMLYGFLVRIIHYAQARSCFDTLSTNGGESLGSCQPFALSLSKGGLMDS
ncbi:MAG: hypothetical protein ACRERD_10740, partial [Candidatus Binatia bacterium]